MTEGNKIKTEEDHEKEPFQINFWNDTEKITIQVEHEDVVKLGEGLAKLLEQVGVPHTVTKEEMECSTASETE